MFISFRLLKHILHWPKNSFGLKVEIKIHFSFSLRKWNNIFILFLTLNNIVTILFHYLLLFFRQFCDSIFPKHFIFLMKEQFPVHLTFIQRTFFILPLREFCKDQNKWKSEGTMSDEHSAWIRTSKTICNSFCLIIKETCGLALSRWKIMCFLVINSSHFSSSAAVSQSNREQHLLELIV